MPVTSETFANAYASTLSASVSSAAASVSVASAAGAPRANPTDAVPTSFKVIIDGDTVSANTELALCTYVSGSTFQLTRACESYPGGCTAGNPVSHASGVPIRQVVTADSEGRLDAPWRPKPRIGNWQAWSCDPTVLSSTDQPPTGDVLVAAIWTPRTVTATNMVIYLAANASVATNTYLGLYNASGASIGVTGDFSASVNASAGSHGVFLNVPILGGPVSYVPTTPDDYLYGAWVNGSATTPPSILWNPCWPLVLPNGAVTSSTYSTGATSLPPSLNLTTLANGAYAEISAVPWIAIS